MISISEKMRLQQLSKAKYLILTSILHNFQFCFLIEPHICYKIHYVNVMVLLYLALNLETYFKKYDFGKFHFVILFWTRSKAKKYFFGEIDLRENFKNRRFRKLILARFFEVLIRWINSTQKFIHVKELMISC